MIEYVNLRCDALHALEKLWYENSEHHHATSAFFSSDASSTHFNDRLSAWQNAERFRCTVGVHKEEVIAYIISTIKSGCGEIESLFVSEMYRKMRLGTRLVKEHLSWFEKEDIGDIRVSTVYLNESAIEFYRSLGFFPKTVTLQFKH
jgi:ribosomal protein S18 acetylase RimI-like enzyme